MITRLGKNALWLFASRLSTQAMTVLFTVFVARQLGSAGFGVYAFLNAVLFIGNMLTTFGTDMLLMREIAARRDLSQLPAALLLQLGLSLLFILFVGASAPLFPNQSNTSVMALRIYTLSLIPLAFYTIFTTALRGTENMGLYALLGFASAALQLIGMAFVPAGGILALVTWLFFVQVAAAVLAGYFCTRQIPGLWQPWRMTRALLNQSRRVPELARASAPIAWLSVLSMLYQKMSILLLSAVGGSALTGWFAAAQRVVEASKTAHNSVFTALYPTMARAEPGTDKDLRLTRLLLLAGAAILALSLSLLAQPLVLLFLGPEFTSTVPVLRILAWMLVPYTLNTYFTLAFVATRQERQVAIALSVSLLVMVLLNLWWITPLGLVGAALAALIAECSQAGVLLALRLLPTKIVAGEKPHELSKLS